MWRGPLEYGQATATSTGAAAPLLALKTRSMLSGAPLWNNRSVSYPPRVALVIADSSRTGGPEHVLTLAEELRDAGWYPLVIAPTGPLHGHCSESRIAAARWEVGGAAAASAPMRLRQLLRRSGVDLVHSHGLRAGALTRRARPRLPHVHTHHLDGWFTAGRVRLAAHRRELRLLARGRRLQIAVSTSVQQFLLNEVGVDPALIRLVPNGVRVPPAAPRSGPTGAHVGVLARLVDSKGVDLAVLALAAPGGRNLHLRVGGTGPELARLLELAVAQKVADRVDFVGEVTDREAFFGSCDLVWVPSRAEPFGLVACEAMGRGVPVVASRVGGLPDILDPPRSGICVAPANPAALASVSAALLEDHDRYARLSEAGLSRVRQEFSAARMGARTRRVYRELIG